MTAAHCLFNGDEYTTKEGGGSSCGLVPVFFIVMLSMFHLSMEEYYDFEEYMDITKVAVDGFIFSTISWSHFDSGSCLFGNTCDKKEWNSEHLKIVKCVFI